MHCHEVLRVTISATPSRDPHRLKNTRTVQNKETPDFGAEIGGFKVFRGQSDRRE